jgi:hypothetical protein
VVCTVRPCAGEARPRGQSVWCASRCVPPRRPDRRHRGGVYRFAPRFVGVFVPSALPCSAAARTLDCRHAVASLLPATRSMFGAAMIAISVAVAATSVVDGGSGSGDGSPAVLQPPASEYVHYPPYPPPAAPHSRRMPHRPQPLQHQTQGGGMLDAKQFGAVGDGVTDDGPALQRALDASLQQHRALFVPAGTYLVNNTLTVRNNKEAQYSAWGSVRLLGEGNLGRQTVITPGRTLTAILAFASAGPQGASWACAGCPALGNTTDGHSVEGVAFDSNRLANFSVFGPAVCRSEFLRCSFDEALISGLYIGWGWINTVSGCWARGNGLVAMWFDWAANSIDVIDSNFEGNHGIGIIANDGYSMRVEGCCFESMGGPAMVANRMSALTYRANYHEANNLNDRIRWYSSSSSSGGQAAAAAAGQVPQHVCSELVLNGASGAFRFKDFVATATLNTSSTFPFYQIAPLPLGSQGASDLCAAVIIEANFRAWPTSGAS